MVEAAFVTHFPIPPIYPYLPFTPGYLISWVLLAEQILYVHMLKPYSRATEWYYFYAAKGGGANKNVQRISDPWSVESRSNRLCTTASPGRMEQDCNFSPGMVNSRDVDLFKRCQFRLIGL